MSTKAEQRKDILIDVLEFAQTHHIQYLPPQKKYKKYPAKGKEKHYLNGKTPVNRPIMNFDLMPNR